MEEANMKRYSWKSGRRQDKNVTNNAADPEGATETSKGIKMESEQPHVETKTVHAAGDDGATENQAEEDRLKLEEEALRVEELKTLETWLTDVKQRQSQKHALKEENLAVVDNRPEINFSKLDSSLKKNTAFVRKLKMLSESQRQSLINDFKGLNLTKYISEVAVALSETKLKVSDISCFLEISSLLHRRYADFSAQLLEHLQKCLLSKRDEKPANPSKYRVDLRLLGDLVACGVVSSKQGLPLLANQIQLLTQSDMDEHVNLGTVIAFCRYCGDDYAGLVPRKIRVLAEKYGKEIVRSDTLPPKRQEACRMLLGNYYQSLMAHVIKDHTELHALEKQNRRILHTKGELSTERTERTEQTRSSLQKLLHSTEILADLLDEDMPQLPVLDTSDKDDAGLNIYNPDNEYQYDGEMSLFEDEDTRAFYETLPDLKARIPGILYKDSQKEEKEEKEVIETEGDQEDDSSLDVDAVEQELEEENDGKDGEEEAPPSDQLDLDEEKESVGTTHVQLDDFIVTLSQCVNRDLIDQAAVDFCMSLNTKGNRKRLVRALFGVPRTRLDLLPFYARFTAVLHTVMPDVASDLAGFLKQDLRYHMKKKDQINIESKIKTSRFIGEMVKFGMFSKQEALNCLKQLLANFTHHNVDMACALLETCGRFLFRSPDSHHRTRVYLEVMMRKKSKQAYSQRYSTMIENAFYYSNPPETQRAPRIQRPPMHQYIRRLLYKVLSKTTVERVIRQLRKLDWDNAELRDYCIHCISSIWNVKFNCIQTAANLLAGLTSYHESMVVEVLDNIIEDIRLGMEINHPKFNQRRVACVKFLGEMYNYKLTESTTIFKTLYSFITFGVSLEAGVISPFDAPDHLFRIRLTCVLLDTCGSYFDRGLSKRKLDYFLIYFQRYYWYKKEHPIFTEDKPFPIDVINLYEDTMLALRPKLKRYDSFTDANEAAVKLDKQMREKLAEQLPQFKEVHDDEITEDGSLAPISETDEQASDYDLTQGTQEDGQLTEGTSEDDSRTRQISGADEDDDVSDAPDVPTNMGQEEDQVKLLNGPKLIKCQEDDDFLSAFDRMMSETITARSQEAMKAPQVDIAVPMQLKGRQKEKVAPPLVAGADPEPEPEPEPTTTDVKSVNMFNFTLITRKGNKQQFKNLNVPVSSEFASKFKEREEAERLEKERVKLAVLSINERQEEEDYQAELAMAGARPVPLVANQNREKRVRYQHPKGAPDADAIFGSKKR